MKEARQFNMIKKALEFCIRIHLKILCYPDIEIDRMIEDMRQVYAQASLRVIVESTEILDLPDLMNVYISNCRMGMTTASQDTLFKNRHYAKPREIVVYFVRSTTPYSTGCAAHPSGSPSVLITKDANRWTLAHEVGHLLGLTHITDNTYLMTGNGTQMITSAFPSLSNIEIFIINESPLVLPYVEINNLLEDGS
jgi:hypothetical protein